jgi:hypothetical protein
MTFATAETVVEGMGFCRIIGINDLGACMEYVVGILGPWPVWIVWCMLLVHPLFIGPFVAHKRHRSYGDQPLWPGARQDPS